MTARTRTSAWACSVTQGPTRASSPSCWVSRRRRQPPGSSGSGAFSRACHRDWRGCGCVQHRTQRRSGFRNRRPRCQDRNLEEWLAGLLRCAMQKRLVPSEFVCDPGRLRLRRAGAPEVPISPTSRGEPADRVGQCRFGRAGQVPSRCPHVACCLSTGSAVGSRAASASIAQRVMFSNLIAGREGSMPARPASR